MRRVCVIAALTIYAFVTARRRAVCADTREPSDAFCRSKPANAPWTRAVVSCAGSACSEVPLSREDLFCTHDLEPPMNYELFNITRSQTELVAGKPGWRCEPILADGFTFFPNAVVLQMRSDSEWERANVDALVHGAGCRVMREKTYSSGFIVEIPWRHPGTVFEVAKVLERAPEVDYAEAQEWIGHWLFAGGV